MIYLDYNATTPIHPEVLDAMMPYFTEKWGNPSSSYRFGSSLKKVIEEARENVAELIGAQRRDILFTSCATESNNSAIYSALKANPGKRHIITSQVEHSSVLEYCKNLEKDGYNVTYLPVDREGLLNVSDLENAITNDTAVVSLMWANNETGVLFPVLQIAEICKSEGVLYHCDAVQAVGKIPIDLNITPIDYLSITGHKIYAPKGIGALFVRRKTPFIPIIYGGHQERGLRAGTENVPLIVGLGAASKLVKKKIPSYDQKVRPIRDKLEEAILDSIPNTELNGHKTQRLSNTSNITFHGIESESLLLLLDQNGICASSGSACLADSDEPSHVIRAMKHETFSRQSIRFSICGRNKSKDVEPIISLIYAVINKLIA
jgi:cysteine desulfurase